MDSNTTKPTLSDEARTHLEAELALGEPIPYDDPLFELVDTFDADLSVELDNRVRATRAKMILDGVR